MSLSGALAPGSALVGGTRRARREARDARRRSLRALAFAGFLVCGLALAVLLVAPLLGSPQAADAVSRPFEALRIGVSAPPPPADVVVPARVVATSSCLAPDAHDTVLIEIAGTVRQLPLDACGSAVGRWVTVVAPGSGTAGTARVLGTGGTAPASASSAPAGPRPPSPMVERLSIVLTVVAALGTGGLVVAVARDRRRRASAHRRPPRRRY